MLPKIKTFRILFLLLPLGLQAQENRVWSLKACIDQALSKNITVQQQTLSTRNVRADLLQSRMALLPNLNGSLSNNWQTGFGIDPSTNSAKEGVQFRTNSFGVSSTLPLFNGFQNINNVRLQESNLRASEKDLEQTRNTIILNVCNAYLRVLLAIELDRSSQDRISATRALVERQQKLYDLGGSNKSRLLQLKAQLASEELLAVNSSNAVTQAYLDLWLLIDQKPEALNRIETPDQKTLDITDEPRSIDAIFDEFSQLSPDVKAAQSRTRSAGITRMITQGQRSPRLSLTGSMSSFYTTQSQSGVGPLQYQKSLIGVGEYNGDPISVYSYYPTGYSDYEVTPFSNQFSRNFGTNIGLNLSLPIFNGWNVNTNISKARANEESSRLNEKQIRNTLYRNIAQAYTDFKAAYKKMEANRENLDANKEAFEVAEKQFELGSMGMADYLNSKNAYIRADADHTQARYELLFRRKVLDYYLGKSIY